MANADNTNTLSIRNWTNDVVVGYSGGYVLATGTTWDPLAGNINGSPGTQVNTLFKFDISAISGSVTSAVVTIRPLSVEGTVNQTIGLASYNVGLTSAAFAVDGNNNNADLVNVNWVAGKRTLLGTFTTTSTATDGTGTDKTPVTIDVTAAVQAAKSNGWSYVTFDMFNVSGGSGSGYGLQAGATGQTKTWFYSANGAFGGPVLSVVSQLTPAVLVTNGICRVSITNLAAGPPSTVEQYAAQRLQSAVACATGVTPAINPATPAAVQIKLGIASQFASGIGSTNAQAYVYRRGGDGNIELLGNSSAAVLWAVNGFCRDVLKVTWPVADGQMARVGAVQSNLSVGDLNANSAPDFSRRGWILGENTDGYMFNNLIGNWMAQTRQNIFYDQEAQMWNSRDAKLRLGIESDTTVHSFYTLIPTNLFAAHPEYFPLINGVRVQPTDSSSLHVQICFSNAAVLNMVITQAQSFFAQYPEVNVFGVCQNDGDGGWCQCPFCQSLDGPQAGTGKYSNRMIYFANQVANALAVSNPGKMIGTFAYAETLAPPTITAATNLAITFTTTGRNYMKKLTDTSDNRNAAVMTNLTGWLGKSAHVRFWEYYYYTGLERCAMPWTRTLCNEFHDLYSLGLEGICSETYPSQWAGMSLFSYAFSQLSWNTSLTYDQIITNFCSERYGPAAATMAAYHRLYENVIYTNVPLMQVLSPGEQLLPNAFNATQLTTLGNYLTNAAQIVSQSGSSYNVFAVNNELALFNNFKQLLVDPATIAGIGANMVLNPGAELSTYWATDIQSGTYTFSRSTSGPHSGFRSFNIHCTGTPGWSRWYNTVTNLKVGTNYAARIWLKANTGASGEIWLYCGSSLTKRMAFTDSQSQWVMLTCPQFTATDTNCTIYLNSFGTGDVYFDDILLAQLPAQYSTQNSAGSAPFITTANNVIFDLNQPGYFTIAAVGSPTVSYTASGLPSWATFDGSRGVLSGTPTNPSGAPININFTAANDITPNASQAFTLYVRGNTASWQLTNPTIGSTNVAGVKYLTLTYSRYAAARGATTVIQSSSDLRAWSAATPDFTESIGLEPISGDPLSKAYFTIGSTNQMFYRLSLTLP